MFSATARWFFDGVEKLSCFDKGLLGPFFISYEPVLPTDLGDFLVFFRIVDIGYFMRNISNSAWLEYWHKRFGRQLNFD